MERLRREAEMGRPKAIEMGMNGLQGTDLPHLDCSIEWKVIWVIWVYHNGGVLLALLT